MPNPIDDDEKLAAAIGRAVSYFAHVELHLARVFAGLTGMDHTMAVTVFRMFRSVPNQKDVLLSVAKVSTLCDDEDFSALTAILTNYVSLASHRNEFAHNPLGWRTDEMPRIYRMKREKVSRPGMFPYSSDYIQVEDVVALVDEIKSTVTDIVDLESSIFNKRYKGALSLMDQVAELK